MKINLEQIQAWMADGFNEYEDIFGERQYICDPNVSADENRELIRKHGEQYVRVLTPQIEWQGDRTKLQKDLQKLKAENFPVLDLVELMFACTRGGNYSIWNNLRRIGIEKSHIEDLRSNCEKAGRTLALLNSSAVPGPLFFLPQYRPQLAKKELTELKIELYMMPFLLLQLADWLKTYPPEPLVSVNYEMQHFEQHVFNLLLKEYGCSQSTLSRILSSMRRVREIITPDKKYVLDIKVKGDGAGDTKDTYEASAIQKRLSRYKKEYGDLDSLLSAHVRCYVISVREGLQRKGTTFLSTLPQVLNHTNL